MPPLRDVLARLLAPGAAPSGTVLEIASGSGYHAAAFAAALPHLIWQPSDPDADARASIAAHAGAAGLANLKAPLALDVRTLPWPVAAAAAVVCINMIHISPWEATEALFAGAGGVLPAGGLLVTYGPYLMDGDFQAESNAAFDRSLKARDPAWGLRDLADLAPLARAHGLGLDARIAMPANNHTLVFKKS